MKKEKKSLPGSQKPGKSNKLKRKINSSYKDHFVECHYEMRRLDSEQKNLEDLISRVTNMEDYLSEAFTCSLCELNIASNVRYLLHLYL